MSYSLVSYHFNPYKIGQIVKQYAKNRGISQTVMASKTGLSYDTVGNIYAGKVQKIPFEYIFKICVVLAIPVEVIMMLMLKDEDIDFEDEVLLYDTSEDKPVPVSDAVPTLIAGSVPDAVADTVVAVAAVVPAIEATGAAHDISPALSYDDISDAVEKVRSYYEAHIQDLKEAFEKERESHERHCKQLHELAMGIMVSKRQTP